MPQEATEGVVGFPLDAVLQGVVDASEAPDALRWGQNPEVAVEDETAADVRGHPAALRMGLWPELTYFYYYDCVRGPQSGILVFLYHYLRVGTTFRPPKHP